jgi:S1-C subfamily serine protease
MTDDTEPTDVPPDDEPVVPNNPGAEPQSSTGVAPAPVTPVTPPTLPPPPLPMPPPAPWPPAPSAPPSWPLPPVNETPPAAGSTFPDGSIDPTNPTDSTDSTDPTHPTDPGIPANPTSEEAPTVVRSAPPLAPPSSLSTPRRGRQWIGVAAVAALIGGGVGAGVTALADNGNGGNTVTIHEGDSDPGAAVLSGNVTIPQLVKKVIPAVVSIDVKSKGSEDEGTGMIITSTGEVVTNNHVIELFTDGGGTGTITVTEYGQKQAEPATLIGYNTQQDVALLKINNPSAALPTVTFGSSSKAVVGDSVVAIGNALGLAAGTPTVTQGIVSALGRSVSAGGEGTATESLQNLIQTDAAINPGNSGGPLIDTAGQVIGMNTAVAGTSEDGTDAQNIGFAIPIDEVESLLPQLEKGGPATNGGGYLGVDITTLTSALRQQYGFTPTSGVVVLDVISDSPAAKAGLVQGDVIVDIDGAAVSSAADLQNIIQNDKAGQSVQVTYYVGNSKRTTAVTLGTQAEEQQQSQSQNQSTSPFGAGGFSGSGSTGGTSTP